MKAFRRCPRLYQYRYVDGIRPRTATAESLRFGALMHAMLEAWWRAARDGRLEAAIALLYLAADAYEAAKARVLMEGYDARWGDEPLDVLAVEVEFRTPLVNPATGAESRTWQLGGKLDAVCRDRRDGRELLVEHKTTSEDVTRGAPYWKRLRLDGQVSVYFAGAKALDYDIEACLYDVIVKPLLRPGTVACVDENGVKIVVDASGARVQTKTGAWRQTADTAQGYVLRTRPETADEYEARLRDAVAADLDRYYARGEIVRLDDELREHGRDVWELATTMRQMQVAGRAPRNPDACQMFNRECEMWPVCGGESTVDNPALYERVEHVHGELSMAKEEPTT